MSDDRFAPHDEDGRGRPTSDISASTLDRSDSMEWELSQPSQSSAESQVEGRTLWIFPDTVVAGGHAQGSLGFAKAHLDTPERKDSFIELTKPLTSLRKSDLDDIALAKDPRVIDLREVNVHTMHTMVRPFIDRKGEGGTWSREYSLSVSLMDREMGDGFGKRFYDILATPNGSFRTQEKEEGRRGIDVVKKEQQWAYADYEFDNFYKSAVEKCPDGRDPDEGKEYSFRDRSPEDVFGCDSMKGVRILLVDELVDEFLHHNLDKKAGVEMRMPEELWWDGGLCLKAKFADEPKLRGTNSFATFSSHIASRGGFVQYLAGIAFEKVEKIRAALKMKSPVTALTYLAGTTSRSTPAESILQLSKFHKNLRSTALINSLKPYASPLSRLVPSDPGFGDQDWSVYKELNPKSNGQDLCETLGTAITDALQPQFDRLLLASRLDDFTMSRSAADAKVFLESHEHATTSSSGGASTRSALSSEHFFFKHVKSATTGKRKEELEASFDEAIATAEELYQPADTREAYVDSCASFKPQKVDIALGISEMEASLVKSVDKITTDSAFLIQVGSLLGSSNSLFSINHNDWSLASGLANLSRAKARLDSHKSVLGPSFFPLIHLAFTAALAALLVDDLVTVSLYVDNALDSIWRHCATAAAQDVVEVISKDVRGMLLRFGLSSTKERGSIIQKPLVDFGLPSADPRWYLHLLKEQEGVCFMHNEACGRKLSYDPFERMQGTIERGGEKISVGALERRSSDATKLKDAFSIHEHYPCPYQYFCHRYNETLANFLSRFAYLYHVTDRPGRGKPRLGSMGRGQAIWEQILDQDDGEEDDEGAIDE